MSHNLHVSNGLPRAGKSRASREHSGKRTRVARIGGILALVGVAVLLPVGTASADVGVPTLYDIDADGYIDPSAVDADGDGWLDHNLIDLDRNGAGDTWLVDQTQDGLFEQVQVDTDGDGWVDLWLVDGDQNAVFEFVYVDADRDLLPDGVSLTIQSLPQPTLEIDWASVCATDPFMCGQWPQASSNGYVVSSPYLGGPSIGAGLTSLGVAESAWI